MTNHRRSVRVKWTGRSRVFEGTTQEAAAVMLDGDSSEGPSPTEALLMSLGACIAIDVREILEKGRVTVSGLEVEVNGDRAPEPPRRFTSIRIAVKVKGPVEADRPKLERAIQLSHDKYCSVFHTLRSDMDVRFSASLA